MGKDALKKEAGELLTGKMLEKVSGGSEEWLEKIDCPRCGAIVWYCERGRYAYECDCGWFSGRTD